MKHNELKKMQVWENIKTGKFFIVQGYLELDLTVIIPDNYGNDDTYSQLGFWDENEEVFRFNEHYFFENNLTCEQGKQLLDSIIENKFKR